MLNDFVEWMGDEHPFYLMFAFIFLGIVAFFAMISVTVLAVQGFWIPLAVVISAPLIRVVFLYVEFMKGQDDE